MVIIALGNWASGFESGPGKRDGDKTAKQQSSPLKPATRKQGVDAAKYQPRCDEPKSREEADVCAQLRVAAAAEDQVGISKYGLGLLLATLGATAAAAIFTGLTWRTMEKTAKRQLRAYVSASPFQINRLDTTTESRVFFDMRNFGQTPAYKVAHSSRFEIFDYPLPPNFHFPGLEWDNYPSLSTIHPGEAAKTHSGVATSKTPLSASDIGVARVGKSKRLYAYGVIKYVDVFDKPRETKFCFSVNPGHDFGIGPGQNLKNFAFEATDQHNECT